MNNIYDYSKQLHNHIITKAFHPYLRRFLYEPVIEEKKLLLLIILLKELDMTDEERDQYITAAMLMQTALDVHDNVSVYSVENQPEMLKNRQLTILAGDYYSGLYYYILAQVEHIDLIRALAEGTKVINQEKIILHENHFEDEQALVRTLQVIESGLITKVAECFCNTKYKHFIGSYLLLNRLQQERKIFKEEQASLVYNAFSRVLFGKDGAELSQMELVSLVDAVDKQIRKLHLACAEELDCISPLPSDILDVLQTILFTTERQVNSLAEEG
ncbi:MAG: heptaprenyl diphosphate synthase component 1 [Bacillus sp. (in: firmicutes)]